MLSRDESDFQTPARSGRYESAFYELRRLLAVAFKGLGQEWPWPEWRDPDAHELLDGDRLLSQSLPESPLDVGFFMVDAKGESSGTEIHAVITLSAPTRGSLYEPPGMDVEDVAVLPFNGEGDLWQIARRAVMAWAEFSTDAALEGDSERLRGEEAQRERSRDCDYCKGQGRVAGPFGCDDDDMPCPKCALLARLPGNK